MIRKDKNVTDRIDDKCGDKIFAMIKFLVHPLVDNMKYFAEKKKYIVKAMENYFTSPKLMEMLREFMIGVVGTARFFLGGLVKIPRKLTTPKSISMNSFGVLINLGHYFSSGWTMELCNWAQHFTM